MLVAIALDKTHDNPQLIFESMNSTGKDLSQADLIRNYILMGLTEDEQNRLYSTYWRPMEQGFGQQGYADYFDWFMRDFLTSQNNSGHICKINEVLNKMAVGDMTASIDIDYVGGFAPIKKSVEKILFSLNNTLSQINEASEQVASGSEQVSGGAQSLSQGATEQASSIEELSSSINEISEQVKQNAKKSSDVSKMTNSTAREVEAGSEQMELMTKAMLDIKQSSNEIAKIIKAINDIAFQTNILALNAAVEAARAGSAGKGFAVVADEVRNLASKSAESAKNTTALIENSIKAVEKGTKIADKTAGLMVSIVSDINKSVLLIDQITEASNEQAVSIMQVTQGIEQISSVVQTNSATSEESAAASEELSGQANRLKNLVSKFKLRNASVNKDTKNDANTELAL